jgi:hypothetical protein
MRFIFQNSLEADNFDYWGGDYLWCFHSIASTSLETEVCALAREMGSHLAAKWHAAETSLPPIADAGEAAYYISMLDVTSRLGAENRALLEHVRQESRRFTARDYLGFDPAAEPPPSGEQSRYDLWCDALVLTYTGDGCGIPVGASYLDVLRWRAAMLPYRGAEGGTNPEFREIALAISHLIYTLNDYNRYRLPPELLPEEVKFLRENLKVPLAADDPELLGEFVDCLRSFGLAECDPGVNSAVDYLIATQNPDGSWGSVDEPDVHVRYHTAWTAVDALRDYAWQERSDWPPGIEAALKC